MSVKINLKNKNVLITGAGGSIGTKITLRFLEAGANCICLDKDLKILKSIVSKNQILEKITYIKVDFEKKFSYKFVKIKKI